MYSRRQFGRMVVAGSAFTLFRRANADSLFHGVRLGAITYSFHDMPNVVGQDHVDMVIQDCHGCGVELIELMSSHVEPVSEFQASRERAAAAPPATPNPKNAAPETAAPTGAAAGAVRGVGSGRSPEAQKAREALREWRLSTPMSHFKEVKKKFDDAGIVVYAYTVNGIGSDFTGEETDKVFDQAKTLGASTISSSTTLEAAQRVAPFAEKHQFPVAFHNHQDITDPNQFATPESFYKAMAMSPFFRINLDIGYITGSNVDAVAFIRQNHARITHLHIKDRKKNLGPSVPWGQGDTPVTEVLTLLRDNRYPMPALVELSYPVPADSTCVQEVAKCMAYMKRVLA